MLLHVPRTRRRWPTTRQRACAAVAVAALAGWQALSVADRSMTRSHYLCRAVGGQAGDAWQCPDATAYAWPLLLIGGGVAGAVLVAYVLLELRRAGGATAHDLADVAVQLGAAVLLGTALLVSGVWLTALAPLQGVVAAAVLAPVAGAASLVGRRRDGRARAVLVACTAAAVAVGLVLMLVLPLTAAAALCWLAAVALRALARRRDRSA